jgi:hypothetical protein
MARVRRIGGRSARKSLRPWYVPWLEILEQRLPPGDALASVLAAGSLLNPPGLESATPARGSALWLGEDGTPAAPVAAPPRAAAPSAVGAPDRPACPAG